MSKNYSAVDPRWQLIWKWQGPRRVRTFMWLAVQGKIQCNTELYKRRVVADMGCIRCNGVIEDAAHAFRDCVAVQGIWRKLFMGHAYANFFSLPLDEWIFQNLKSTEQRDDGRAWACTFGVALWRIWCWRNKFCFEGSAQSVDYIVKDIFSHAEEIMLTFDTSHGSKKTRIERVFGWKPPPVLLFLSISLTRMALAKFIIENKYHPFVIYYSN